MISTEILDKARAVCITDYLTKLGIQPVSMNSKEWVYNSVFREEKTASLHVYLNENRFHDFGDATKGKNIVDLVQNLHGYSFKQAVEHLTALEPIIAPISSFVGQKAINTTIQDYIITENRDLQHPALIRYVESRKISFQTAYTFLREIHYSNSKGKFFGVGYQTDGGGYVVRSEIMKKPINLGKTDIKTFVVQNSKAVSVFEGMFDFLSAIEYYKSKPRCTAIILNSLSNISKAMPLLEKAEKVYTYLDLDVNHAGQNATQKLKDKGFNVYDQSSIYDGFKDFNEFLMASTKPP